MPLGCSPSSVLELDLFAFGKDGNPGMHAWLHVNVSVLILWGVGCAGPRWLPGVQFCISSGGKSPAQPLPWLLPSRWPAVQFSGRPLQR